MTEVTNVDAEQGFARSVPNQTSYGNIDAAYREGLVGSNGRGRIIT